MNRLRLGYLQVIVSAATFAASSVVAKWAYAMGFTPFSLSLGSSLVCIIILGAAVRRRAWLPPRDVGAGTLILYGLTGGAAGLLFLATLAHLDISLATLLLFTYPAVVAAGAWIAFGQQPTTRQSTAIAMTLIGAALTVGPIHGAISIVGLVLALGTNLAHSVNMLMGERLLPRWDSRAATAYTRLWNGLICLAVAPATVPALAGLDLAGWGFLTIAAITGTLAPFLFLFLGIANIGASRAAIVSTAELPIALFLGWLLMADRLTALQSLGAVLIIAAVVAIQQPDAPSAPTTPTTPA